MKSAMASTLTFQEKVAVQVGETRRMSARCLSIEKPTGHAVAALTQFTRSDNLVSFSSEDGLCIPRSEKVLTSPIF